MQTLHLLLALLVAINCQIQLTQTPLLQDILKPYETRQNSLLQFTILKKLANDYPQLKTYSFISINRQEVFDEPIASQNETGQNGTNSQESFMILLEKVNKTLWIVARVVERSSNMTISFTNLTTNAQPSKATPQIPVVPVVPVVPVLPVVGNTKTNTSDIMKNNSQVNSAGKKNNLSIDNGSPSIQNKKIAPIVSVLGGQNQLKPFNDPIFNKTFTFLTQQYPNLINYEIIKVKYQLVSGTFYKIQLKGYDNVTRIAIQVHSRIGNKETYSVQLFDVDCQSNSTVKNCTKQLANSIYKANELVLEENPELKTYTLNQNRISVKEDKSIELTSIFLNKKLSLKAISDVSIQKNILKVLSFYIFPL